MSDVKGEAGKVTAAAATASRGIVYRDGGEGEVEVVQYNATLVKHHVVNFLSFVFAIVSICLF